MMNKNRYISNYTTNLGVTRKGFHYNYESDTYNYQVGPCYEKGRRNFRRQI